MFSRLKKLFLSMTFKRIKVSIRFAKAILKLGLGLSFFLSLPLSAEENPPGWLWYQDPFFPQEEQTPEVKEETLSKSPPAKPDIEALTPAEIRGRSLGRQFEAQVALSLENPTFENVRRAQALQREMFDRAEGFQKMWQQVSLMDPETYNPETNPNTAYRALYKKRHVEDRSRKIKELAKSWGLFFLVKKGCPYCAQFEPQVKRLETQFGFEVKVVSPDGGQLELFSNVSADNGSLESLNPQGIYPALLLAHPDSGTVVPLSWGMTSYDQLLENFDIILQTLEAH